MHEQLDEIDGIPIEARATFHFACAKGRATCNMLRCTTVQLAALQPCTPQELDVLSQIPHYVPISAHKEWNLDELLERMWEYAHWAHPRHICTGTGLAPATSAPGLPGSPLPHPCRDWARPGYISAPGLQIHAPLPCWPEGNQPTFGSSMYEDGGVRVRVLTLPQFATTPTCALVSLSTLEAVPITFGPSQCFAAAAADPMRE